MLLHCVSQVVLAEILFVGWSQLPLDLARFQHFGTLTNYTLYAILVGLALLSDGFRVTTRRLPLLGITPGENVRRSGRQVVTVMAFLFLYIVASKDAAISRIFLFSYLGVLYSLLFVTNRYLPPCIARWVFPARHRQRTIIVGCAQSASDVREWVASKEAYGIDIVAHLTSCDPVEIKAQLSEHRARQLLIWGFPPSTAEVESLAALCDGLGVRLLILNDWIKRFGRSMVVAEDGGHQFICFHRDLLECPLNRTYKRAFDLFIALPVCILILPILTLIIWIIQRCQSPGPVFFRQRRIGTNSREFLIWKYRTMTTIHDSEDLQATDRDPRVFPAGRWLRKLSIDEMPQFINVLFGEMSVVGPRPHLRAHDEEFATNSATYRLRQQIKPGITGLAQVTGWRGQTKTIKDIDGRVEADLRYVENWSISTDLRIVVQTVSQLLNPPTNAN